MRNRCELCVGGASPRKVLQICGGCRFSGLLFERRSKKFITCETIGRAMSSKTGGSLLLTIQCERTGNLVVVISRIGLLRFRTIKKICPRSIDMRTAQDFEVSGLLRHFGRRRFANVGKNWCGDDRLLTSAFGVFRPLITGVAPDGEVNDEEDNGIE